MAGGVLLLDHYTQQTIVAFEPGTGTVVPTPEGVDRSSPCHGLYAPCSQGFLLLHRAEGDPVVQLGSTKVRLLDPSLVARHRHRGPWRVLELHTPEATIRTRISVGLLWYVTMPVEWVTRDELDRMTDDFVYWITQYLVGSQSWAEYIAGVWPSLAAA